MPPAGWFLRLWLFLFFKMSMWHDADRPTPRRAPRIPFPRNVWLVSARRPDFSRNSRIRGGARRQVSVSPAGAPPSPTEHSRTRPKRFTRSERSKRCIRGKSTAQGTPHPAPVLLSMFNNRRLGMRSRCPFGCSASLFGIVRRKVVASRLDWIGCKPVAVRSPIRVLASLPPLFPHRAASIPEFADRPQVPPRTDAA